MGAYTTEDRILILVIAALTAGVFVLDLLTPLGIAIWALYVLPLGLSRWFLWNGRLTTTAGPRDSMTSL